jgi:hypothetical protein
MVVLKYEDLANISFLKILSSRVLSKKKKKKHMWLIEVYKNEFYSDLPDLTYCPFLRKESMLIRSP